MPQVDAVGALPEPAHLGSTEEVGQGARAEDSGDHHRRRQLGRQEPGGVHGVGPLAAYEDEAGHD